MKHIVYNMNLIRFFLGLGAVNKAGALSLFLKTAASFRRRSIRNRQSGMA